MKNPVVLHVVRPYPDERAYLAAEAWTIDERGMFLIDDRVLTPETAVVFDVALQNGTKVIRAEGRVEHHVAAEGEHPAGLRVRFRRFGAQTKSFIDRAVGHTERRVAAPPTQRSAAAPPSSRAPGRSAAPPPIPVRASRPVGPAPSQRASAVTKPGYAPSRPPPLPPRRSMTPPAGTPLFDPRSMISDSPASQIGPRSQRPPAEDHAELDRPSDPPPLRAEAEPILPRSVRPPPSRKTSPGMAVDLSNFESMPPTRELDPGELVEEHCGPPTPPVGSIEEPPPSSRPPDSEPSGVRALEGSALARPKNREQLLARLRERAKPPESGEVDLKRRG
jgi:hypothetical protein